MKKILVASTALVAAGMLTAGSAAAAEKIKLNLGGFSKWFVVGAWQDADIDNNSVDIKGNNEVFFGGKTTLDNGLEIGVDIQLEAGGNQDTNTDTIDESYIWIAGGFGKLIVGSENNGAYLLHVTAPDAAGNWNEDGIILGRQSIVPTGTVTAINSGTADTTAIQTDGDAEGVTYVAPSFGGLTVGATYKPNVSEDVRGPVDLSTQVGEVYGVGALYANSFSGVGVKVSGGWATYKANQNPERVNAYSLGTQVSAGGFTVGASGRINEAEGYDNDGYAWDLGVQYAAGPYAVSVGYFNSKVEGAATSGDDEVQLIQASGKYNLGPGVDALLTAGHVTYKDEGDDANKGFVVAAGIGLSF